MRSDGRDNKRMHRSGEAVRFEIEDHLSPLGDPGRSVAFEIGLEE